MMKLCYKLNTGKVLISKPLIDLYVTHDEFVSTKNVLREYNEIERKNKNFCGIHYINMVDISRKSMK